MCWVHPRDPDLVQATHGRSVMGDAQWGAHLDSRARAFALPDASLSGPSAERERCFLVEQG